MKICKRCSTLKELSEFNVNLKLKSGLGSNCYSCRKEINKKYNDDSIEKRKQYYLDNKELKKQYAKEYRLSNSDKIKQYIKNNKSKFYKRKVALDKQRRIDDPLYRFNKNTRSLIYKSFKKCNDSFKKNDNTENILGCSIKEFQLYLQNKFTYGMSLDNYGKWHIDHIIPISSAKIEEDVIKLNHYTNLQPLWAEDNWKKGTKICSL